MIHPSSPSSILHPPSAPSPSSLAPRPSPLTPSAFTLTELLVVLAIIVLILAAAVPAFNMITGSRSADAAENQVSAMLVRARAAAVRDNTPTGVAFFVNPASGRATMALVTTPTAGAESRYYRGWTKSALTTPTSSSAPTYLYDQHVSAVVIDNSNSGQPAPYGNKLIVGTFSELAKPSNTASDGTYPPNRPNSGSWSNGNWIGQSTTQYLDFAADAGEFESLPAGVAVQLINDPKAFADSTAYPNDYDHYVQTGVILFDEQGRLVSTPISFSKGSQIYNLLAKNPTAGPAYIPSNTTILYSQLGLIIYDRATFLNQPNFTEGDTVWQTDLLLAGPTASGQESTEEKWLDDNTTPLFVNRSNGTLLKGQ